MSWTKTLLLLVVGLMLVAVLTRPYLISASQHYVSRVNVYTGEVCLAHEEDILDYETKGARRWACMP